MVSDPGDIRDAQYTQRLVALQQVWWKRLLDVQAPYRWNLRHLVPGFTLEVGCGIGRNLANLRGNGVGVDLNDAAVAVARRRGFLAFTTDAFRATQYARPGTFDSLLLSHVLEHMRHEESFTLLTSYVEFVRPGGQLIVETPQERGYRSDASHVHFIDFDAIRSLFDRVGATVERQRSFPLPRAFGRFFIYNEFIVTGRLPGPVDREVIKRNIDYEEVESAEEVSSGSGRQLLPRTDLPRDVRE
jgi:SAM-dependent methyltransferase